MPHIFIEGQLDMEEVFRRLKPVFVKSDRGILKATDTYMDRSRRNILIEAQSLEGGEEERFLIMLSQWEDAMEVHLYPHQDVDVTEGVKQVLAEAAKQILEIFPELKVGDTDLDRYLE
jgi:hypothetical protein